MGTGKTDGRTNGDAILDSAGEVGLQEEHRDSLRPVIATFLQTHMKK